LDLALPEIPNKSYGFLLTRSLKKNAARNKRAKNAVSTSNCATEVFCISCFDFTSHTSPGQRVAFVL